MSETSPTCPTAPAPARRLVISVVGAVGRGSTLLSSFDDALRRCGVHNYNLIALSSVIPPASTVLAVDRYAAPGDEHGDRLYVVKAEARGDRAGAIVGAGIGWFQWGDGRGVFVEHEATGTVRDAVQAELDERITRSLRDLCRFRDVPFEQQRVRRALCLAEVDDQPTTALVVAVYRSERWT